MDGEGLILPKHVAPTERKDGGGSWFDDELETEEEHRAKFLAMVQDLQAHLQQRPDHVVFVGTVEDRAQMRAVFNWWYNNGFLSSHPTIKIDYGVPEGTVRIDEDRS